MPWQVGGKSKGFLFLLLAVGAPQRSGSVPYMLLSSGGSKCVSVDAPRHTTLRVDYFVPDLMVEDEEELKLETDAVNSVSETEPRTEEGLDSRFNDYQKRRMELLKKARHGRKGHDTNILLYQREEGSTFHRRGKANPTGSGKIRQQIDQRAGSVEFRTGEVDGPVEVCVQSYSASRQLPVRVALNVTSKASEEPPVIPLQYADIAEQLNVHMSKITVDLKRSQEKLKNIMANAGYAREMEVGFHGKSLSLSTAIRYWPMFRMAVLIFAGFLQVRHVVQYMKSRRIY
jgi:hypothetical protein